jgi:NAD(P)-dependent dehydrogenase (short-subunit alcohol dehydrogenase family)
MSGWTPAQLDDLTGKTYVITGGNSGLGLEAAKILCGKGATVVITTRSEAKATKAIEAVKEAVSGALVRFLLLDLADLDSVDACAEQIVATCPKIDALINNAGVMQTPELQTKQGFELQFGTNHLGHFRLVAKLYPHLNACGARVVVVSSIAHKYGKIDFDNLMMNGSYDTSQAYFQSKLANIMFAFEFERRLRAAGSDMICIPVHPGYSNTNLQSAGVGMDGGSAFFRWVYAFSNRVFAQAADHGAYPEVLAAADPTAKGGTYYGPTSMGDTRGPVGESSVAKRALDQDVARRLWDVSEELVGAFDVN